MTFLSIPQLQATLALKIKMSSKKVIVSIITLSTISVLSIFSSSTALASSCSKSDIDFYLQRGFTNDQVVQLCSGSAQNTGQQTQSYQAPAQTQQSQQQSQTREDESYLSAALAADGVTMTSQSITLLPLECIQHGPTGGQASADLQETICVDTKVKIDFSGMIVGKPSRGFILVKKPKVNIKGNIQREFIGIDRLRKQDRSAILEKLSKNPKAIDLKIRRGINVITVAQKLRKYSK